VPPPGAAESIQSIWPVSIADWLGLIFLGMNTLGLIYAFYRFSGSGLRKEVADHKELLKKEHQKEKEEWDRRFNDLHRTIAGEMNGYREQLSTMVNGFGERVTKAETSCAHTGGKLQVLENAMTEDRVRREYLIKQVGEVEAMAREANKSREAYERQVLTVLGDIKNKH